MIDRRLRASAAPARRATRSAPRAAAVRSPQYALTRRGHRRRRRAPAPRAAAARSAAPPARTRPGRAAGTSRRQPAAADADHLQDEVDRKHHQAERHRRRAARATSATRQRERPARRTAASSATDTARGPPAIARTLLVPQPLRAVDRRKQRADDADAAAADDVDLDAGFVERAQHAGVIRAGRAGAGQHERGASLGRVGVSGRGRRRGSVIPAASSWMVTA